MSGVDENLDWGEPEQFVHKGEEEEHPKNQEEKPVSQEELGLEEAKNFTGSTNRIQRIKSEEVIHPHPNVPSSPNDKRNSGIVLRVKFIEEVGYLPPKILIEIRNEAGLAAEEESSATRQTKLVSKEDPTWDEDFYYNNNVVLDDNIVFILRAEGNREIARAEVRNLSIQSQQEQEQQKQEQQMQEEAEPAEQPDHKVMEVELKDGDKLIAKLFIEVKLYEREDLLGGVLMPNLSLRPPKDFKAQYNAIDTYRPEFTNQPGSRANCFNFYDAGLLPGFDNVEVFPPKIQRKNRVKQAE